VSERAEKRAETQRLVLGTMAAVAVLSAGAPLGLWDMAGGGEAREREAIVWALWGAALGLGGALWAALSASGVARLRDVTARALALDLGLVTAVSLVVRFGLTELNILTDGGTGYARVMSFRRGFGGLSVLIDQVFGELGEEALWRVMPLLAVLAALLPPAVLALGRALGFGRAASLFAGLAVAAWPLHAALFTSDFLMGPLVTLATTGLALLAFGVRGRPAAVLAGATLLAYAVWFRPEAVIVGLPVALLVLPRARWLAAQPVAAAGLAWLALHAAASIAATRSVGSADHAGLADLQRVGDAITPAFLEPALLPPWLTLPFFGLLVTWPLRRRWREALVVLVAAGSAVPVLWSPAFMDPLESYVEVWRYGAWTFPWLALGAGAGLAGLASLAPAGAGRAAAHAVLAAVLAATPVAYLDYLGRVYVNRAEEAVFRGMIAEVPEGCALVVPDDDLHWGTHEHMRRFLAIVADAQERGETTLRPSRVVGLVGFVAEARATGSLPALAGAPRGVDPCWYWFRGSYCDHAIDDAPAAACGRAERTFALGEVARGSMEFLHHRLVSVPRLRGDTHYRADQPLVLYRLLGVVPGAAGGVPDPEPR
jgi:hypothetical protein